MKVRVRGRGPFKQQWYSICSSHREHDEACPRCLSGHWVNVYAHVLSSLVYRAAPGLWRWWANRRR